MHPVRRIYLDNAATSFPKPPCVHEAMARYATTLGASPGRGAYEEARQSAELMQSARSSIARFIGAESPERVIFTLNTSDALNLALRGLLEGLPPQTTGSPLPHVVTTEMDHNSVLRPLNALEEQGRLTQTRVPVDPETGIVDPQAVLNAVRPETFLVAVVHASNVTGSLQPIEQIGAGCSEKGVPLLVDAAQTIGHMPIDVRTMKVDLLAFPGHKGLLGPLGTGGLYIRPGLESRIEPVRHGGTGSVSESDRQPDTLPDKYEPGSHNAIGLIGLGAAVGWITERGIDSLHEHERLLTGVFLEEFLAGGSPPAGMRLLGPHTPEGRVGVFAITLEGVTPAELADRLESDFGVLSRSGLHCAPGAHQTFGTHPEAVGNEMAGATRLSVGPFVTVDDIAHAARSLRTIAAGQVAAV